MNKIKTQAVKIPDGLMFDPNARTMQEVIDSAWAFVPPPRWMTREEIEKEFSSK